MLLQVFMISLVRIMPTTQGRGVGLKAAVIIAHGPVAARHAAERLASVGQVSQWWTAICQIAQGLASIRQVTWNIATHRLPTECWTAKAGIAGHVGKTASSFLGSRYP